MGQTLNYMKHLEFVQLARYFTSNSAQSLSMKEFNFDMERLNEQINIIFILYACLLTNTI